MFYGVRMLSKINVGTAVIRNYQKNVIDTQGNPHPVEGDAQSYLIGLRYLTTFDLTTIIEYYHNGTGFSGDDMKHFYAFIDRGYGIYQNTGNAAPLIAAQQMAAGNYGRFSPQENYLYLRLSQKEPFDILYFTPAVTGMMNTDGAPWPWQSRNKDRPPPTLNKPCGGGRSERCAQPTTTIAATARAARRGGVITATLRHRCAARG